MEYVLGDSSGVASNLFGENSLIVECNTPNLFFEEESLVGEGKGMFNTYPAWYFWVQCCVMKGVGLHHPGCFCKFICISAKLQSEGGCNLFPHSSLYWQHYHPEDDFLRVESS